LGDVWADLIRFGQNQNLASQKNSISYAKPKRLLFLVSIAGTTGMNMNIENNILRLFC